MRTKLNFIVETENGREMFTKTFFKRMISFGKKYVSWNEK